MPLPDLRARSVPALVLGFLLCLFYSIIFSGQVLGFLGIYYAWTAIPLTLVMLYVSTLFFPLLLPTLEDDAQRQRLDKFTKLDRFFGVCAVVLIVGLIVVPLVLWPASPAGKTLTWDAGLFQFPKAIELFRSGSLWNMNVCYAEYPTGYESLLAFSMLLGGGTALYGTIHALLALFLISAIWLLGKHYTNLPSGLLLFAIVLVLLYGFINKDNNPWWIYQPLLLTVGKNDLFQGAAVLAVLAFAPLMATRSEKFDCILGDSMSIPWRLPCWNIMGFAMASMVAFSIKPNSLIILLLWLLVFYYFWKESKLESELQHRNIKDLLISYWLMISTMIVLALPGLLWIIRNLVGQGALFTKASVRLTAWSMAANLTNPAFYKYVPVYLYFFLALTGGIVLLAILRRRLTVPAVLMLVALLVGFAVTPASAFHGNNQERAEIAWRFAVAFISYALVLLLVVVAPLIKRLIALVSGYRFALVALALGALALSGFFVWRMRQLVRYVPENAIILQDQFEQPVGSDGYYSAYDYTRKNIHNSAIIVDNGLPFYAYDAMYTNTTACAGHADYFIVFNTDWASGNPGDYPDYVQTDTWAKDWDIVYQDSYSRVFRRR